MFVTDYLIYNTPTMKNQLYFESRVPNPSINYFHSIEISYYQKIIRKSPCILRKPLDCVRHKDASKEGTCNPEEGRNLPSLVTSTGGVREITINNF